MRLTTRVSLALAALIWLSFAVTSSSHAFTGKLQIPAKGTSQTITMEDGSTLVGRITMITENEVKFQTAMGEMTLAIAKIKEIKEIKEIRESREIKESKEVQESKEVKEVKEIKEVPASSPASSQNWFPNPNRTRLLIGPTARTLKGGKGYFYDLWIFFPGLAYGVTDNFMISGGASIIPDADDQMFYVMPKFGYPAARNLDVSATLAIFRLWEQTFYFGMGGVTIGTDNQSITGALGLAFTDEEMADQPAAMVGGEYRLANRMSLVGESWFIPGDADNGILGMAALRLMGEQMTIDVGFGVSYDDQSGELDYYGNPEESETDWVPYVDFVWNF
jgi:hypothetical protein